MLKRIEQQFGPIDRLPHLVQWLSDKGGSCIANQNRALGKFCTIR